MRSAPSWNALAMPSVSITCGAPAPIASVAAATIASACGPSVTKTTPGLVQNCPAPISSDAAQPDAISPPRAASARGITKTGLIEPSSPKKGIGWGRAAHRS